jgi:hypothetical protein
MKVVSLQCCKAKWGGEKMLKLGSNDEVGSLCGVSVFNPRTP